MKLNRKPAPAQQENRLIPVIAIALVVLIFGTIIISQIVKTLTANDLVETVKNIKDSSIVAGETQVDGQMFIVTKGAGSYKLALVSVIFEKNNEPVASIKTDADGKFSIKLPRGDYRVQAYASRKLLDGETEFYEWNVPISLTNENQTIYLSNDNMK